MAQNMTESALAMSGSRPSREPNNRITAIETAARSAHWPNPRRTASRKSERLRARSPAASARAMKVMTVSSSPKMPILLTKSVVAQATEKTPSAAGPSRRATRNVKMPRKFEASIAMKFVQAPRFSSGPGSTWCTTPPGGVIGRSMVSAAVMIRRDAGRDSSATARMTADDQSVLHLMDPVARFGDLGIVRHEHERLSLFLDNSLEQLEGAARIRAVQVAGRFVGQDHAGIIGE